MADQLTRIGRGVPGNRGKRKLKPQVYWVLAAAVLIAVGAMVFAVYFWNPPSREPVAVGTSPTPTRLDEHATCVLLVPTLTDATKPIQAIVDKPDGSTVDKARLDTLIKDLHTIRDVAPQDMLADIDSQIEPLETLQRVLNVGGKLSIPLDDYRASGLRLAGHCSKWAS